MIKKIICVMLALCMLFSFAACNNPENSTPTEKTQLATPQLLNIASDGYISWQLVDNATTYVVNIDGEVFTTSERWFQAPDITKTFTVFVIATAEGFFDSQPTETRTFTPSKKPPIVDGEDPVTVGIGGGSEIKGHTGKTIQLTAKVNGTDNTEVVWSVEEGGQFVEIDNNGKLTVTQTVDGDKLVTVKAVSKADSTAFATRIITVVAKQQLTQQMLDVFSNVDKIGFEGYLLTNAYEQKITDVFYRSYTSVVKTAMDGTSWYAEYANASGNQSALYCKNVDGIANQCSLSFTNDEDYTPIRENNQDVTWQQSGLYNNLKDLSVSDFEFNVDTWRYEYVGGDQSFVKRVVASANPYDFVPVNLMLIIDEGQIMGLYSQSEPDYTVSEGYKCIHELFVAINIDETVTVPTIGKYNHQDIHDQLQTAIDNMKALTSYKTDVYESIVAYGVQSQGGYVETVTPDTCYFQEYTMDMDRFGNYIRTDVPGDVFGFKKIGDNLYNQFYKTETGFTASRAFEKSFDEAKPSFEFSAELFRSYYQDAKTGEITYYVDAPMSQVATTFYMPVGNDRPLYGIYAQEGYINGQAITPYVVVKDGYIVQAGFYFNMLIMYGAIIIEFSDFNTATLPEEVSLTPRYTPNSWTQLNILVSSAVEGGSDTEVNAWEYLKELFGSEQAAEQLPFFGDVLGDTFGLAYTTLKVPTGGGKAVTTIYFYYDVPLELDTSISTALNKLYDQLTEAGYTRGANSIFSKGNIRVQPLDVNLDLIIYVWAVE